MNGMDWMRGAACHSEDLVLFFGADGERAEVREPRETRAKAICSGCPARTACPEYAVGRPERHGVYGGMTPEEREAERRRRRRRAAA